MRAGEMTQSQQDLQSKFKIITILATCHAILTPYALSLHRILITITRMPCRALHSTVSRVCTQLHGSRHLTRLTQLHRARLLMQLMHLYHWSGIQLGHDRRVRRMWGMR